MNEIINKITELATRGTCIVSLRYTKENGEESVRNVRLGDKRVEDVPYGKASTSALFVNNGCDLIRTIDHNEGETARVFRVDRILSLTVDGLTITA